MNNPEILDKVKSAKQAAMQLANIPASVKNKALEEMASALLANKAKIIEENKKDIEAGESKNLSVALLDRLTLTEKRIQNMSDRLLIVRKLPDPVNEIITEWKRPNGLKIKKIRVPLGVIGIIYEARPNVTVDSVALCLKSGNATVLRGGSDAINSNIILTKIISEAAYKAGIPEGSIQLIESTDRNTAIELMKMREYVDVLIPRGGSGLIKSVVENSKIPTIETGEGNCHAYVEKSADLKMAEDIVYNAKCSRPSVCNAIETLLVDEEIAGKFLPKAIKRLMDCGVELRGDEKTRKIDSTLKAATEEDWKTEYLSLVLAIKIVSGVDEAIAHINKYNTKHSETIITKDKSAADKFCSQIDAAALYVNASTRFTDGYEFGFGAEIGISTQKLHARGPMGLKELTSYKYLIEGKGQVRVV